ncbi:MAG: peptidase M15 [Prevotella sp.]|nr:peptidase M15 [Prevotella sp.]
MKTQESNSIQFDGLRLSTHFTLGEFLNLGKYPDNIPTMEHVVNMTYGCLMILEPARRQVGPILVSSGYRNPRVNQLVGGVPNSQHQQGQTADIRPKDPQQFQQLVDFLRHHELTDQLLTGNGWLHISWKPCGTPRRFVRIGYYR